MTIRIALPLLAMMVLAACNRPVPPAPDTPPEPQAAELRDAFQKPIDRAKAVSDTLKSSPPMPAPPMQTAPAVMRHHRPRDRIGPIAERPAEAGRSGVTRNR